MRDLPPIGSRVRRACPLGTHCWGDNCCPSPLHRDGWVTVDEIEEVLPDAPDN